MAAQLPDRLVHQALAIAQKVERIDSLVPMAMPALASHLTDVEFRYCDNKYYELCGQMEHMIGPIPCRRLSRVVSR